MDSFIITSFSSGVSFGYHSSIFLQLSLKKTLSTLPSNLKYALLSLPSLSPLPLIQAVGMISHYPLATLLPWPPGSQHHCPDLDCSLLLEGEGGVALQRYQPRYPESTPHHWVSTHSTWQTDCVCVEICFYFWEVQVLPVFLNNVADVGPHTNDLPVPYVI